MPQKKRGKKNGKKPTTPPSLSGSDDDGGLLDSTVGPHSAANGNDFETEVRDVELLLGESALRANTAQREIEDWRRQVAEKDLKIAQLSRHVTASGTNEIEIARLHRKCDLLQNQARTHQNSTQEACDEVLTAVQIQRRNLTSTCDHPAELALLERSVVMLTAGTSNFRLPGSAIGDVPTRTTARTIEELMQQYPAILKDKDSLTTFMMAIEKLEQDEQGKCLSELNLLIAHLKIPHMGPIAVSFAALQDLGKSKLCSILLGLPIGLSNLGACTVRPVEYTIKYVEGLKTTMCVFSPVRSVAVKEAEKIESGDGGNPRTLADLQEFLQNQMNLVGAAGKGISTEVLYVNVFHGMEAMPNTLVFYDHIGIQANEDAGRQFATDTKRAFTEFNNTYAGGAINIVLEKVSSPANQLTSLGALSKICPKFKSHLTVWSFLDEGTRKFHGSASLVQNAKDTLIIATENREEGRPDESHFFSFQNVKDGSALFTDDDVNGRTREVIDSMADEGKHSPEVVDYVRERSDIGKLRSRVNELIGAKVQSRRPAVIVQARTLLIEIEQALSRYRIDQKYDALASATSTVSELATRWPQFFTWVFNPLGASLSAAYSNFAPYIYASGDTRPDYLGRLHDHPAVQKFVSDYPNKLMVDASTIRTAKGLEHQTLVEFMSAKGVEFMVNGKVGQDLIEGEMRNIDELMDGSLDGSQLNSPSKAISHLCDLIRGTSVCLSINVVDHKTLDTVLQKIAALENNDTSYAVSILLQQILPVIFETITVNHNTLLETLLCSQMTHFVAAHLVLNEQKKTSNNPHNHWSQRRSICATLAQLKSFVREQVSGVLQQQRHIIENVTAGRRCFVDRAIPCEQSNGLALQTYVAETSRASFDFAQSRAASNLDKFDKSHKRHQPLTQSATSVEAVRHDTAKMLVTGFQRHVIAIADSLDAVLRNFVKRHLIHFHLDERLREWMTGSVVVLAAASQEPVRDTHVFPSQMDDEELRDKLAALYEYKDVGKEYRALAAALRRKHGAVK